MQAQEMRLRIRISFWQTKELPDHKPHAPISPNHKQCQIRSEILRTQHRRCFYCSDKQKKWRNSISMEEKSMEQAVRVPGCAAGRCFSPSPPQGLLNSAVNARHRRSAGWSAPTARPRHRVQRPAGRACINHQRRHASTSRHYPPPHYRL